MIEGILILWFFLTLLSMVYLIYDFSTNTPLLGIMKVAWLLVFLYLGPVGLFIYFISCRQPMPNTHDSYIRPLWKQAVGSVIHCLAGDATGILLAAIAVAIFPVSMGWEAFFEYIAGFIFGWFIFQAVFMKDMMGGYVKALTNTFMSEWLSMNLIMSGMIPVLAIWRALDPASTNPLTLSFWGAFSLASIVSFAFAYPINYWLVKSNLKHGMMTAGGNMKKNKHQHAIHSDGNHSSMQHNHKSDVSSLKLTMVTLLTLVIFAVMIYVGFYIANNIG